MAGLGPLERLAAAGDEAERRKLAEQVRTELRARAREMARYLDGERTLALAVLAVPDAAYAAVPEARAEGFREGVLVVPYTLALPAALLVYRLALRFDSKWPALGPLERLATAEDEAERRKLAEQVRTELRARAREMARYLDGERTLALAVLAVPDAAYAAVPEARAEGFREGVLVVPYTLALPAALLVYRLALRFGAQADGDRLGEALQRLGQALAQADEELEGRVSRGLVQLENGRDALRRHLAEARQATASVQPGS